MTQIQAETNHLDPSVLGEYWEALKAVRRLKSQAYRWAGVMKPENTLGLNVFLDEAERSLDPIVRVLDRMIRGEAPDALSTLGPLPPPLGAIDYYRDLLLGQAKHWLQKTIDFEESMEVPRCDGTDRFPEIIIRWRREKQLARRAPLDAPETEEQDHVTDESPEQLLKAIHSLLGHLTAWEIGDDDDYLYWIMGIDAPAAASSRQEVREAAARAQDILTRAEEFPDKGIQRYAFVMGRSEEILGLCQTIRGFQDALISKAREELAAIEEQLAQPMPLPNPPDGSSSASGVFPSAVEHPAAVGAMSEEAFPMES